MSDFLISNYILFTHKIESFYPFFFGGGGGKYIMQYPVMAWEN